MSTGRIHQAILSFSLAVMLGGCAGSTAEDTTPMPPPGTPTPGLTATPTRTPEPTATPTITPWPTRTPEPTWTPTPHPLEGESERILFTSNEGGYFHVLSMDPGGARRSAITADYVVDDQVDWSSSAGQIAFVSDRDGNLEIYALRAGDYYPRNLTNDPLVDMDPDWSPDGSTIAFTSDRDHKFLEIYVMDSDGENVLRLTENADPDWEPAWSPSGDQIAFVAGRDSGFDIWLMEADGSSPTNLTRSANDCANPAWSPDGTQIAFSEEVDENWDIYVLDVQAALDPAQDVEPRRLTDDPDWDGYPTWSPDGKWIAFQTDRTGNEEIYVLDPAVPFDSQRNISRHAADDTEPNWVQTPSLEALQVEDTAVFRMLGGNPTHLDPVLSADSTSHEYVNELFSGLVRLDDELQVAPDIATHWDVSAGGTVYTFYLRDDVKFQDGKPVTAHDIEYAINRACDPDTGSTTAGPYLGDIIGVDEVVAGEADAVSGVRVIDDYTLEITIDAPKAYFLAKLTYPASYAVDEETIEKWGDEWERHPNGTGPFRLGSWADDVLLVLVRNDLYYGGLPSLKRVSYHMEGIPMLMYEEGLLETVPIGTDDVQRVQDPESPLHEQLVEVSNLSTSYVAFNCAVPPFDDPKVRQAFAHAFDRQKLIEVTFESNVFEARGILPPGMPAYDPDLEGLPYDPDWAVELLAESTYGGAEGLPEITMVTSGRGGYVSPVVEAFVSQIRENLGIDISIDVLEPEEYYQATEGEHTSQVFSSGWIADYPDPENFLDMLFHSDSEANESRYANPELDALLEQARTESNAERRWELYGQAERLIVADAPWIPLYHSVTRYLIQPYVKGLVYTPQGIAELGQVTLEDHQ